MATFEEFMKVAEISIKDKTSHKRMRLCASCGSTRCFTGLPPSRPWKYCRRSAPRT